MWVTGTLSHRHSTLISVAFYILLKVKLHSVPYLVNELVKWGTNSGMCCNIDMKASQGLDRLNSVIPNAALCVYELIASHRLNLKE